MTGSFGRLIIGLLPFVIMAIALYIVFRLIFVGRPPKSKPSFESHDHLRE